MCFGPIKGGRVAAHPWKCIAEVRHAAVTQAAAIHPLIGRMTIINDQPMLMSPVPRKDLSGDQQIADLRDQFLPLRLQ